MATFTYNSFIAKQGVLVENGGGWTCTAFGLPCTQGESGSNYGPITGTAAAGTSVAAGTAAGMYLRADINLATTEFVDATSMLYTLKWQAMATYQGGNPSGINVWTLAGPLGKFFDFVPYTADDTSVTHNGEFGNRPGSLTLVIQATIANFDVASITLAFSGISFEIHDVVYGNTPATPTSAFSVAAGSSIPVLSSPRSTSTSATNSTTFLSSSTSFITTISGQATIIQTIASQSLPASESRSHPPSLSNSPSSTPMTVTELASVITGSIIGVGLVLLAITFWYQWRRRRRMTSSGKEPRGDGQSGTNTDSRMGNQEPWVPRPYRKRPYSRPTTETAAAAAVEEERAEPAQPEEQESRRIPSWQGDSIASLLPSPPPPAYSQITPPPATRSIVSSMAIENT